MATTPSATKLSCSTCEHRIVWLSPDQDAQMTCDKYKKNISFLFELDFDKPFAACEHGFRLNKPVQQELIFE